jgi:hypothetical protein
MLNDEQRIAAYKGYLAAFNEKSLTKIKEYLSPDCVTVYKGEVNNYEGMIPTYTAHWEREPSPIELREIRPIKDGVWVMLRNVDKCYDLEVEYYYNEEGLQIKHDIKPVIYYEKEETATT